MKGNYNEGFGSQKHSKNWEAVPTAGAFKGVAAVIKSSAGDQAHRDATHLHHAAQYVFPYFIIFVDDYCGALFLKY